MTAISEQKMDTDSSTGITDECRSARNKISAARELYLEWVRSAKEEDINALGFRPKIRCERAEMLMILQCYKVHLRNYDSIVNDIINRSSELHEDAAEFYNETPKFKLKTRIKNQIYTFPSKKKYIRDEELNREYQDVRKMQEDSSTKVLNSPRETTATSKGTEQSNTTAPLTKDKRVDGAAEGSEAEVIDAITKYKYPFENLVLQGGGAKGIAYCGLIKVLEDHGILQQMKRFAGTSAGAITAALLAVGYNSSDAEKVLGVDFEKLVKDSSRWTYLPHLFKGYGVNTGKRFDRVIGDLLALKTGNPDVTFEEVYDRFNKELCLVVVNVDTSEEMYCHVKTTPQMPVRLAVRMSMSIPVLFQAVKHKHSYFVDGGLLCNYPIHCFDGWFLSMKKENTFFNKIQSLNDLQEITSFENQFKNDPENKTTIGGMVYCDGENISYRQMLEQSTGFPVGKLPDTALARNYADGKDYGREIKEIYIKAVKEFYKVLPENKDNSMIKKKIFMDAFKKRSFTAKYKNLLFGERCDPEIAWKAVNKYGRGEVQFTDIKIFIESAGMAILKTFKDRERKNTSNLLAFVKAMFFGLSENTMQNFFKSTDVERSVGINTWYVQTRNFKLEEGDKIFLTNQGRDSTLKFLTQFALNNDLRILTETERRGIVISTSVDETELEKIIEAECTVSLTLTNIVIANIPLLLVWGLLYVVKN